MEPLSNAQQITELVKIAMSSNISKKDFGQYINYKRMLIQSNKRTTTK